MGSYYSKAGHKKRAGWRYCTGIGTLIGVPAYTALAAIGFGESKDPVVDDCCIGQVYIWFFGNQCVNDYQTTCLVVGIISAVAVPVLWGGSAGLALAEARMESTIDTLSVKSPDTTNQKPSFVRRCLFGKRGSW